MDRHTVRLHLRLTAAERRRWQEIADKEHLTIAELVRAAVELAWVRGSTR